MKKLLYALALLIGWGSAFAQQKKDPEVLAKEILSKLEDQYKKSKSIRVNFTYEMSNEVSGVREEMKGEFIMKRNKYRLKLAEQEVINNGKTQWTYLKEANEVNISDYNPDNEDITPEKIFTLYKKDYKSVFVEEVVEMGKVYQVVDLQPLDRNKKHFKIRIKVNKQANAIKSWEIFEKNQNRFKYLISVIDYDVLVGDGYFNFKESDYPNVEIIDLRN
jgi:outer membrane lipoprotein-sorting protein